MSLIEAATGRRADEFKKWFIEAHKDGRPYCFYIGSEFYQARVKGGRVLTVTEPSMTVKQIFAQCGWIIERGELN